MSVDTQVRPKRFMTPFLQDFCEIPLQLGRPVDRVHDHPQASAGFAYHLLLH